MGFNSVYRCLQELFPQVDARLLRAVAIEHPKDADVAAEIILTEVIPSISKKLLPVIPSQDMSPRALINLEDENEEQKNWLGHHQLIGGEDVVSSSHARAGKMIKAADPSGGSDLNVGLNESMQSDGSDIISKKLLTVTPTQDMSPGVFINLEDESEDEREDEGNTLRHRQLVEDADVVSSSSRSIPVEIIGAADSSSGPDLNVASNETILSNTSDINDDTHTFLGINEINEPNIQNEYNLTRGISNKSCQEISNGFRQKASKHFDQGQLDVDVSGEKLVSNGMCQETETGQNHLREEIDSTSNNVNRNASHLKEEGLGFLPTADDENATICDTNKRSENCETASIEVEGSEAQKDCHVEGLTPNANDRLQIEFNACPYIVVGETSDVEDEIGGIKALGQYDQACRIDMLEETIDEAKTNKKTLFASMETLINLMREVELQEKAAEQAYVEAASGGSAILVRADEYKAMLVHAKEANDMHAGEIYGEKAILATELKELQSRLSSLSDEKNKSLAILEEMRQVLESRLAAAENLRKALEHEKLEKEESARKALLEQEAMMEKVVQESMRLQQEAEENSKLREFLMDRGRLVDTLQGEISVICQDVRLLKEKFDANLPLSKSFTASQTSCVLASSGSSYKTLASNVGSEHGESSEILKISPAASIASLSSKGGQEEERSKADHKALLDDGWDIFEKDAELDSGV